MDCLCSSLEKQGSHKVGTPVSGTVEVACHILPGLKIVGVFTVEFFCVGWVSGLWNQN